MWCTMLLEVKIHCGLLNFDKVILLGDAHFYILINRHKAVFRIRFFLLGGNCPFPKENVFFVWVD